MKLLLFVAAFCLLTIVGAQTVPRNFEKVNVAPGYKVTLAMEGLNGARTLLFDSNGDMLVLARSLNKILLVYGDFEKLSSPLSNMTIVDATGLGLNHGMAFRNNYVYASSDTTVYRWPYTPGSRQPISNDLRETVIINMESSGNGGAPLGHFTRTLVFGPDNYLYVSIGSLNNVDTTSYRSRVRRVQFDDGQIPSGGFSFQNMEVWADGLRNGVAMAFDKNNKLWEADNGPDELTRTDIAPSIYQDNPAEELNLLDGPAGTFYGYPFCWTAGNITSNSFSSSSEKGTQYAWPATDDGLVTVSDDWCRNTANNRPPAAYIPAHSSPITAQFLLENCGKNSDSFSCDYKDDLFVSLHGSWNRELAAGYRVIHMPFDRDLPTNEIKEIFSYKNYQTKCIGEASTNGTCFRPAGMVFDRYGYMWVSSAISGELVRVTKSDSSASGDVTSFHPPSLSSSLLMTVVFFVVMHLF